MDNVEKLIREVKASRVDGVWNEMVIPMAEIIRLQHEAKKKAHYVLQDWKPRGPDLPRNPWDIVDAFGKIIQDIYDETNRIAGEVIDV